MSVLSVLSGISTGPAQTHAPCTSDLANDAEPFLSQLRLDETQADLSACILNILNERGKWRWSSEAQEHDRVTRVSDMIGEGGSKRSLIRILVLLHSTRAGEE